MYFFPVDSFGDQEGTQRRCLSFVWTLWGTEALTTEVLCPSISSGSADEFGWVFLGESLSVPDDDELYLVVSNRCLREGNGNPLQYFCLENLMDGGAWQAAVHGVAKSRTWLSDFTFHFHALEKEMATHSSVLAWRIPGTGEPGGLPSMGSNRVGHDWSNLAVVQQQQQVPGSPIEREWLPLVERY